MKTKNKLIKSLTPEQELKLKAVYLEWLDTGRSVEPINKEAAIKVATEMYRQIGKPAPAIFFFSSPMMCILAWGVLHIILDKNQPKGQLRVPLWDDLMYQLDVQLRDQLDVELRDQLDVEPRDQLDFDLSGQLDVQLDSQLRVQLGGHLRHQLDSELWSQLMDQLGSQLSGHLMRRLARQPLNPISPHLRRRLDSQLWDQLMGQLGSKLWDQLIGQLGSQLGSQLLDHLWNQLGGKFDQLKVQLWDQLRDHLVYQLASYFGGQHWVGWQVFYKFWEEVGCQYTPESAALLDLWIEEGRALHWWFPYEGIVLMSERHTTLHLDDRGRLHGENDIACGYSDGWGIYAWHGIRVPEWIIRQPETITLAVINQEQNAEIRRVMVERYGLDRLKDQGTLIHQGKLRGNFPQYIDTGGKKEFLGYVAGEETVGLYELPVENAAGRRVKVIHVTCPSTLRDYVLGVDARHTNAIEAVASTFGLTEQQYCEAVCAHS